MIQINCESCGKSHQVDASELRGKTTRLTCSGCGHEIVVQLGGPSVPSRDSTPYNDFNPAEDAVSYSPDLKETTPDSPGPTPSTAKTDVVSRQKVRFGLSVKVIALMLIISLAPFCLYWGYSYRNAGERIRQETGLLMAQTAEGLGREVDEWIDKNVRVLKTAAHLQSITSMQQSRQEAALKTIAAEYPWMYLVFTLDTRGANVARNDGNALRDYSDRQYYKDVLSGKELSWQTLIGKTSHKPALVLAVPIRNDNELIGVMAAAMTIDQISQQVARWKKGKTGFAFLVDEGGKVVAHQVNDFVTKQVNMSSYPLISKFKQTKNASVIEFANDGQTTLGYAKEIRYGWILAIQQQAAEVFSELNKGRFFAMMILVITVVLVTAVAWIAARSVVKPIGKLTNAAERMSLGELDVKIEVKSRDEVGLLAQALDRMRTSMQLAMNRLRTRR